MARRGRPRKPGPRETSGQPQRHGRDRGTKEIQSLRQWWAGPGDPSLTSYPLGVLLANGAISTQQHSIGCDYAWLHWAVFGRVSLAAVSLEFMDRGQPIVRHREAEERRMEEIHRLFRGTRRARRELDNLVIFERVPRWMKPIDPRPGDVHDARLLIESLVMLVKRYGSGMRNVA